MSTRQASAEQRARSRERADAVRAALAGHRKRFADAPYVHLDPRGRVELESIRSIVQPDGTTAVEVYVVAPAGGDPHFRILNPPLLVPDPAGTVHIGGRRFRSDPLEALARVIASAGGAQSIEKRRRRG